MKNKLTIFFSFLIILIYFCAKYPYDILIGIKNIIIPFTHKPTVSVVTSSYNMKKYLPKTIDSIINQTYKDWEMIIIDDGSCDGTQKVLIKYLSNTKIRIVKNKENIGLANSLAKGLKLARGKYIARLDADDYSFPDRLERQVALMEKENLDFSAHTFYLKDQPITNFKENLNTYDIGLNLLMRNRLCHSSVMMRKSFLQKRNLTYTNSYENAEDYELWVKIFLNGGRMALIGEKPIIIYNPTPHYKYWFDNQIKSRDQIRSWAISQIVPKYNDKMLKLSLCQLLPKLIEGNKTTQVLDNDNLKKYYRTKCFK